MIGKEPTKEGQKIGIERRLPERFFRFPDLFCSGNFQGLFKKNLGIYHRCVIKGVFSALEEINRRIRLDFFGVDCAMLPNGKLLLFEANTAMKVAFGALLAAFPYTFGSMHKIKTAFEDMMLARLGR